MTDLRLLYDAMTGVPAPDVEAWLDEHCPDPQLRARLLAMVAEGNSATDLLARPAGERIAALAADVDADTAVQWVGRSIGAFRLRRLIGQGGMAAVFLAEREAADFDQQVAVKLLKRGLFSDLEQQLFRRERQALATLSHPNIARLFDGGIADDGMPFLAMEYVDGVTLTQYCREHQTALRDRLLLLVKVCRAVEAAHRALIVHRDIKPSNILVGADGEPKLLDFGIAKLLDEDEHATRSRLVPLTPEYAAPEQFAGGPITTATDVYALGVLLHELLLGERPTETLRRPSQRAGDLPSNSQTLPVAALTLQRQLRGDLDNIILQALEVEPARRYPSAGALADDLDRHLQGEPVSAHPPSKWYRTRKFVNRHRGSVALTALLLSSLLLALTSALLESRRARAATERADAVRDFIVSVFQSAKPGGPRVAPPTVVEVVERAITQIQSTPAMHPQVRAELLMELGTVLVGQGRTEPGVALLRDTAERAQRDLGQDSEQAALAQLALATALVETEGHAEARELLDALRAAGPRDNRDFLPLVLMRSSYLSMLRREKERGLSETEDALNECGNACSLRAELQVRSMASQAWAQFDQDARALDELETLIPRLRAHFGERHAEVMYALAYRARAARHLSQFDRAEVAAQETIAIADSVFPPAHSRRAIMRNELVEVQLAMRRYAEAEALAREIAETLRSTLGPEHPRLAYMLHSISFVSAQQGKFDAAIHALEEATRVLDQLPSPPPRLAAVFNRDLAFAYGQRGDLQRAREGLGAAIVDFGALTPPDHTEIAVALSRLGLLEFEAGHLEAAADAYASALALYEQALVDVHRQSRLLPLTGRARIHAVRGEWTQARNDLQAGLAERVATPYPDEAVVEAHYALAWVEWRLGEPERARSEAALGAQELARIPDIAPRYRQFADEVTAMLAGSPTR
ncbi:MAG: protein kinase domain-containing protein [Pseudomarimonas sp.]